MKLEFSLRFIPHFAIGSTWAPTRLQKIPILAKNMDHIKTGQIGEEVAKNYLENKGYKIIERNFKTKYAEIDLLARRSFNEGGAKREVLVFVEVRTKRGEMFGSPEETLDQRKLKQVHFAARIYCAMKKWTGPCQIDAVCIVLGENNVAKKINHYENII